MDEFSETLDYCGLIDLGFEGPQYTRTNKQPLKTRACGCYIGLKDLYPSSRVLHHDYYGFDHRVLQIDLTPANREIFGATDNIKINLF